MVIYHENNTVEYIYGIRPLVYLPATIKLTQDETNPNLYRINYGE